MKNSNSIDINNGKRVEISPATDSWMRGDRFGAIVNTTRNKGKTYFHVKLDKSNKTIKLTEDLIYKFI